MTVKKKWIVIVCGVLCGWSTIVAKVLHVTPEGENRASGDIDSPMSLEWAFTSINRAGDTILIHGGDYYGNFTCWASGDENDPLIIKPYNNEVVRIIGTGNNDHTLGLNGDWCEVHGLIITQTERGRVSAGNHSWPEDVTTEQGVALVGRGVKFINNIIHDVYGSGILGSGSNGVDAEAYGNIIFNTGWIGSANGHGHGLYLQSNEGAKNAKNNIVFNTYGHGFQFYTTGGQSLDGMDIEKNIAFNAGVPADPRGLGGMRNMMLGGNASVDNLAVRDNYTYFARNSTGTGMQVGYNSVSESCRIEDNYIACGNKVFVINRFKSAVIRNNTIIGKDNNLLTSLFFPADESVRGAYDWDCNSYYADEQLFFDANNNRTLDFDGWKAALSFDENGDFKSSSALENRIDVIANEYCKGRAHIVVYNWENQSRVSVDLGEVLDKNDPYAIYDVENIFEPLVSGVYDGRGVSIPMRLSDIMQPTGIGACRVSHTSPEFNVFLVTPGTDSMTSDMKGGTNKPSEKSELIVYNKPSHKKLRCVFFASSNAAAGICVFDMKGKRVMIREQSVFSGKNEIELDFSNLSRGMYLLSIDFEGKRKNAQVHYLR